MTPNIFPSNINTGCLQTYIESYNDIHNQLALDS